MGKLNKAKRAMLESSVYSLQVYTRLISTIQTCIASICAIHNIFVFGENRNCWIGQSFSYLNLKQNSPEYWYYLQEGETLLEKLNLIYSQSAFDSRQDIFQRSAAWSIEQVSTSVICSTNLYSYSFRFLSGWNKSMTGGWRWLRCSTRWMTILQGR